MKTKKVKYILSFVLLIMILISSCNGNDAEKDKENIWYQGFYEFCIHAPAKPGIQSSPPMYYESECRQMLQQAKDIDLYHTLIIPTVTPMNIPQG